MFSKFFRGDNIEKDLVFLKLMYALANSDGLSNVEKDFIAKYMLKDGKSKAEKIVSELRKQENENHDLNRFISDARILEKNDQKSLLIELVNLSKLDNQISNEEATLIMIVSEALSFDVNEVMSTLTNHGLNYGDFQSYIKNNFGDNKSNSSNSVNEVGFLAAKKRYEQEEKANNKLCPTCGVKFSVGKFCENCGTKIN